MKMRLIQFIIFALTINSIYSQNIIPNGSFETFTACPTNINSGSPDEVSKATAWYRIKQTPDYFNSCASGTIVNTPNNFFGNQIPASGNAYMGLWAFESGNNNFREIIAAKLTNTLSIGQKYFVKLTVSLAEGYLSNAGIDKIGIRFSTIQHTLSTTPINNFSHIYFTSIMNDTLNWKSVFGSFVADSTYKYVEIGNFFTDANTNVQILKPGADWSYFYIDDVALCTDSLEALNFNASSTTIENQIINDDLLYFYPIPAAKYLHCNKPLSSDEIEVTNLLGMKCDGTKMIDTQTIDVSLLSDGFYIFKLKLNGHILTKKIIIKN